jgi:ATP-dependent RNA helicase DHX37/DHR1
VIVVATKVAETSLTIPGIRYVIDSGREKRKVYDRVTHSTKFEIGWISQASAAQRAGRAGRTGPGHCYRLYSSAVFQNQFPQYSTPEILSTPIDSVLLSMKNMNIESITTFPFPTPPDTQSVRDALRTLTILGALSTADASGSSSSGGSAAAAAAETLGRSERITALGRTLAAFPLAPRFAKMLVLAQQSMFTHRTHPLSLLAFGLL